MDIVIVSQYLSDIENFEGNNSRFVYLVKLLSQNKANKIEIITSDFFHRQKRHFERVDKLGDITITPLKEPGYSKNVCIKRFFSHRKLANNLREYLEKIEKPDVIYTAVPSLSVAEVCADYCKNNKVKFIIDIQDLWPETFRMVMNIPIISDIVFYPMKKQADKIYALADEIVAVSDTYANRAMIVNKKCKNPTIVYLGTEKETFDNYANGVMPIFEGMPNIKKVLDNKEILTMVYCGTLGASYDILCVFEALKGLDKNILSKIVFIVMGDGPRRNEFEEKSKGLPCIFTGRLPYPEMVWILDKCDIAVNPITKGAAQSIINKHMDYAMAGLPVINTQECKEYRELIEKYRAGINCRCNNSEDVQDAICVLMSNRKDMGQNSRHLGEIEFDRSKKYKKIIEIFA